VWIVNQTFSVDEVKQAIWDCDSFKCPGPDGVTVNMGFVKDFLSELRDDCNSPIFVI